MMRTPSEARAFVGGSDAGRLWVSPGGIAKASAPTAVTDGDDVGAYWDLQGRLHVVTKAENAPNQTFVNATASGDTEVVAAVASTIIRVKWILMGNQGDSVVAIHFRSDDTAITGTYDLAANGGGFAMVFGNDHYFCQTVAGEALDINLSAMGTVSATLGYELVTA